MYFLLCCFVVENRMRSDEFGFEEDDIKVVDHIIDCIHELVSIFEYSVCMFVKGSIKFRINTLIDLAIIVNIFDHADSVVASVIDFGINKTTVISHTRPRVCKVHIFT